MRDVDFRFRLDAASYCATKLANTMVKNRLEYDFVYCVVLNASSDDSRMPDEVVYPHDEGVIHERIEADTVVKLLCRDGRVPQWIDIAVATQSGKRTLISLACCGRFHEHENRLYYCDRGTQPFGIKSPCLPPGLVEGKPFKLPKEKVYFEKLYKWHQPTETKQGHAGGSTLLSTESDGSI